MKEITSEFIRLEINRLGAVVVETGLFHPSGAKLHAAGDVLGLDESRVLHAANFTKLFLLDFGEDERAARKSLGVEHLLPANVSVGDTIADDIRKPGGELLLGAGTTIDEKNLQIVRSAPLLAVPIRHRKFAAMQKQAEDYLAKKPAATSDVKEGVTRMMRIPGVSAIPVRYLLVPRARVLIGIGDDLFRTLLRNALTSEGHEVVERNSAGAAVEDVFHERPHIIILDLAEALAPIQRLRSMDGVRNVIVLVCAEDPKSAVLTNAIHAGANDWLPRPPSRDLINDKIKASQDLLGRKVTLAPALKSERRKTPRPATKGTCDLKDPALNKPLPVFTGEIVDLTETGLRIAYNLPKWVFPWAYTVHGVHPRHPFHPYATGNPMPKELRVTIPGPKGAPVEKSARVVHVSPQINNTEIMGLTFQLTPEMPVQRSTTVRKF